MPASYTQLLNYFNSVYGRDDTKLEKWQHLCRDIGVQQGRSITHCKKLLRGKFVNIIDFLEAKRAGRNIVVFQSARALSDYIRNDRSKIFPLRMAKDSPILNWMLIELH